MEYNNIVTKAESIKDGGGSDFYKESSSVFSRNTYFQLRLSIQYVKLRKNGMAIIVHLKLINTPIEICKLGKLGKKQAKLLNSGRKLAGKSQWIKF
jgi:hypothetical protein